MTSSCSPTRSRHDPEQVGASDDSRQQSDGDLQWCQRPLGDEFADVQVVKQGNQRICHLKTADGRCCTLTYAPNLGFTIAAEKAGAPSYKAISSPFFKVLMGEIVKFFACEGKNVPVAKSQTVAVMKLRDAVLK